MTRSTTRSWGPWTLGCLVLLAGAQVAWTHRGAGYVQLRGTEYASLDEAIKHVRPGDTLRLLEGDHVAVSPTQRLDGLRIKGRGARLEGDISLRGNGIRIDGVDLLDCTLTIVGERAKLRGLSGSYSSVVIEGDRARVRDCRIGSLEGAVRITGDRARVSDCDLSATRDAAALEIDGDRARVADSTFRGDGLRHHERVIGTGILIRGARPQVRTSTFRELDSGADLEGTRVRFLRNRGVDSAALLYATGDAARVSSNRADVAVVPVGSAPSTITVRGAAAAVRGNHFERPVIRLEDMQEGGIVAIPETADQASIDAALDEIRAQLTPAGTGVSIVGDHATAQGNSLTGLALGVVVTGDTATVEHNDVVRSDVAVTITGDDSRVAGNTSTEVAMGVSVLGDGVDVCGNVFVVGRSDAVIDSVTQIWTERKDLPDGWVVTPEGRSVPLLGCPGVSVVTLEGGGEICDNSVVHEMGGVGYDLDVDDVVIERNTDVGVDTADTSIIVTGDRNEIVGNRVENAGSEGIVVTGTENAAHDNTVTGVAGNGVVLTGDGNVLTRGGVDLAGGFGVIVNGDANEVHGIAVANAGADALCIEGDANSVRNNVVAGTNDDGVVVLGSDNVLTNNDIQDAAGDGFCIEYGHDNLLDQCRAVDCRGDGLENLGADTSVLDSEFMKNTRDVVSPTPFERFERNSFGSSFIQ